MRCSIYIVWESMISVPESTQKDILHAEPAVCGLYSVKLSSFASYF